MRKTVLIVDDHADFRAAASTLLSAEGFAVVGTAADGLEALDAVERLRPDVVLVDVQLPDIDGFAVAKRLGRAPDPPSVVLISTREAAVYGRRLQEVPVRGFLPKSELSGPSLHALLP